MSDKIEKRALNPNGGWRTLREQILRYLTTAELGGTCKWILKEWPDGSKSWSTGCGGGREHYFHNGTPASFGMIYCKYCGKPIEESGVDDD